jgi:hypothetical protein
MQLKKMMPVFAIAMGLVLAMATSAFKEGPKDKNGFDLFTFKYNPPENQTNPYAPEFVQDESNWEYTTDDSHCSNDDVKACRIFVPAEFVNPDNSLNSSIDIVADGSSTQAYVESTEAGSGDTFVSNKLN